MALSEAQKRAKANWAAKNKEKVKYSSDKSRSRSFIINQIKLEDLQEFEIILQERKKELLEDIK